MSSPPARLPSSPSDRSFARQVAWVFVACLGFYIAWFQGLEWWRHRRGPWLVEFSQNDRGEPTLRIRQDHLGIQEVRLVFADASGVTNRTPQVVSFDSPEKREGLPFGEVRFLDTTFLPGTVALHVCGHEIEFVPRVLRIDGAEHLWRSGSTRVLPKRPSGVGSAGPEARLPPTNRQP